MSFKLTDLPVSERPREKLLTQGARSLSTAELLAILLHSGSTEKTALELANEILSQFEDISVLPQPRGQEMMQISGVGPAKFATIQAGIELGLRLAQFTIPDKCIVNTPRKAVDYALPLLRYHTQEHFYVMLLDTKKHLLTLKEVTKGLLDTTLIDAREVFKIALTYSAASLILLHNHPSGDPTPSREDIAITKRLATVGKLMSIEVVDHIIIAGNNWASLKTENMIE